MKRQKSCQDKYCKDWIYHRCYCFCECPLGNKTDYESFLLKIKLQQKIKDTKSCQF